MLFRKPGIGKTIKGELQGSRVQINTGEFGSRCLDLRRQFENLPAGTAGHIEDFRIASADQVLLLTNHAFY